MSLFAMSDAFRAAAPSRRSRLDFVDSGVLMRFTRCQLFHVLWPAEHVVNVLRHLATRGCEEAVWLLRMLTSERPMPVTWNYSEVGAEVVDNGWLAGIIAREDSPRAWFYRAQLYDSESDVWDMAPDLLRRATEAGVAPAMTALAFLSGDDKLSWLRKAAALHDPGALRELAERGEPNRFALRFEAASLGDVRSMKWLADSSESGLSLLHRAVWWARAIFLGGFDFVRPELCNAVERMAAGDRIADDVRLVHAVGRELEGFEQLWPKESLCDKHLLSIDFYLSVVHTARRAALQTVVAMRERRMPRELAIMIARRVYDSRDDAVAWCERGQIARRKAATKRKKRN